MLTEYIQGNSVKMFSADFENTLLFLEKKHDFIIKYGKEITDAFFNILTEKSPS